MCADWQLTCRSALLYCKHFKMFDFYLLTMPLAFFFFSFLHLLESRRILARIILCGRGGGSVCEAAWETINPPSRIEQNLSFRCAKHFNFSMDNAERTFPVFDYILLRRMQWPNSSLSPLSPCSAKKKVNQGSNFTQGHSSLNTGKLSQ